MKDSQKSPEVGQGMMRHMARNSAQIDGHNRILPYKMESKENQDLMNCVDSKIVQESGVVSITSANRHFADEPDYIEHR